MKLKEIIEECQEVRRIVQDDSTCFNLNPGKGYESPEIILRPARDVSKDDDYYKDIN